MENKANIRLVYAALCLALAFILPFLTGQIPQIGNAISPMHIAVFLCGFLCGWPLGAVVGFAAPLLRSALFGMPPLFPTAVAMALELAAYGVITGVMYQLLPKKIPYIYLSLVSAMVGGRVVWGLAQLTLLGLQGTTFTFAAFMAGAVTNALPGIILHILLVPLIVIALQKAKLVPVD